MKHQPPSFLPLRNLGDKRPLHFLTPRPQQMSLGKGRVDLFQRHVGCRADEASQRLADKLATDLSNITHLNLTRSSSADFVIDLSLTDLDLPLEGYDLKIDASQATLTAGDEAGLAYGMQTLLQLIAFGKGVIPELAIRDWPTFRTRSVMLDMGRGIYTKPMIERTIRIMARLKLNTLHLHLYDDELMGLRFNHLPLGSENPGAISLDDLTDIVTYARQHHISVCPELESWGHVQSVLHHYPECYGAPGVFCGSCFGIGPATFKLLEKIYDEVIPTLESRSTVHLGLDEANWKLLPGVRETPSMNPTWLVDELYNLLMKVGKRHQRDLTMRIWADHGGRPLSDRLRHKVIVEPWNYFLSDAAAIQRKVQAYAQDDQSPFIMGAGAGSMHFAGAAGATRLWCQHGQHAANCLGVTLCLWEGNLIHEQLVSIYAGAAAAWNPNQLDHAGDTDIHEEYVVGRTTTCMLSWQSLFEDANIDALLQDRGPAVYRGYYLSGPQIGQPVAPTVTQVQDHYAVDATQ